MPDQCETLTLIVGLNENDLDSIRSIRYDPTISLRLELSVPSLIPSPGGCQTPFPDVHFLCDNKQKGISNYNTVTVHANPQFSISSFDSSDEEITSALLDRIKEYVPLHTLLSSSVRRWKYAIPTVLHPSRCHVVIHPQSGLSLAFAGDGYLHARVEGACLSGIDAAEKIVSYLVDSVVVSNL